MSKIGVSSTMLSAENIETAIEGVSKEFGLWEIISEGEHYLPAALPRLMDLSQSYKLEYSVHAPMSDVNIAALSERMRESAVIELIATFECAVQLGSKTVTIHPGLFSLVVPGQEERSIECARRSVRTLDRIANDFGISAALENMPSFPFMLGRTADQIQYLLDGTNMKMCFDIGHANTTGETANILSELRDRIVNVHIHDNLGKIDDHMTIGDGNIDFLPILSKLKSYKGNYIIESKSFESAVISKNRLNEML